MNFNEICIAVDDADAGVDAAKAADMTAAGIQTSASYAASDIRMNSFSELTAYLPDLRNRKFTEKIAI